MNGTERKVAGLRVLVALLGCGICACSSNGTNASTSGGGTTGSTSTGGTTGTITYTTAVTDAGTPSGAPATQSIGPSGGTVTSPDGRLDVVIPAGALAAATDVTVQPITDSAPNGLGAAYRLSPDGTTLSAPASLTFHLSDVEAAGIATTYVGTQKADGTWYAPPGQARDTAAQTLTVNTTHFSDWVMTTFLYVDPQKAQVHVNELLTLEATILVVDDAAVEAFVNGGPFPEAQPLPYGNNPPREWAVNGMSPGDAATTGFVIGGYYSAPKTVPSPATVAVSLSIQLDKVTEIALSNVTVIDDPFWTGNSDITVADGSSVHANFTFERKDGGSGPNQAYFIKMGTVSITPPALVGAGCTETIAPDTQAIGMNDGSMIVTYLGDSGTDTANIVGSGTTVWAATLSIMCDNGTQTIPSSGDGLWWPQNIDGPHGVVATNGSVDIDINNALATGVVHLHRGE